jgi:hypothetical protein
MSKSQKEITKEVLLSSSHVIIGQSTQTKVLASKEVLRQLKAQFVSFVHSL